LKQYDAIAIGTGSSMNIVSAMLRMKPGIKVAVIDKDEPGGICLTRGCIPTKLLVYPAELVRLIQKANDFGIDTDIKKVDFGKVMKRMRDHIEPDISSIKKGLSGSKDLDYYQATAEFVSPYTLKVGSETITSQMIFLGIGSKPRIPNIQGLGVAGYHTSDTILGIQKLPESIAIIGGGYIAAEYGHFFSAMGSKVTIIGRNKQFLPQEEPEISALAKKKMSEHMTIFTNHEVLAVEKTKKGKKISAKDRETGKNVEVLAEEILVAVGRSSNTDILHPEKGGIQTDEKGWIKVNEFLETSQPNVWAFGDSTGKHLFKHVANYESMIVFYNAVLKKARPADYHAIPHAVFTEPEIASVGMREKEAIEKVGLENVYIGFQRFEDTAKGMAMGVKDCFVKVIVENKTGRILGAHMIGPQASVLIQEIINLMYTPSQNIMPIKNGMHIHPALSEVVERAFQGLVPVEHYHHRMEHHPGH
jgi:mycothione reductase